MAQINDGRASENCEYPSFFGHQVLIRKFAELSFFVQGCHFKDSKWINFEKINGTLATHCINSGCRAERTDEISISHSGKAWWTEWMVTSYSTAWKEQKPVKITITCGYLFQFFFLFSDLTGNLKSDVNDTFTSGSCKTFKSCIHSRES